MTDLSKAEQELVEQLAEKFHDIYQVEAKRQGDVRHKDAYANLSENIKEFDRVLARFVIARTNALIGAAYEACAGKIENFKFLCEENERAYASAKRIFAQAIRDFTREATRDELERIKAAARLEEATLWSRDKFHKTHSGYCDTLESHVKECSGCQRIAELSAQAKETR